MVSILKLVAHADPTVAGTRKDEWCARRNEATLRTTCLLAGTLLGGELTDQVPVVAVYRIPGGDQAQLLNLRQM